MEKTTKDISDNRLLRLLQNIVLVVFILFIKGEINDFYNSNNRLVYNFLSTKKETNLSTF